MQTKKTLLQRGLIKRRHKNTLFPHNEKAGYISYRAEAVTAEKRLKLLTKMLIEKCAYISLLWHLCLYIICARGKVQARNPHPHVLIYAYSGTEDSNFVFPCCPRPHDSLSQHVLVLVDTWKNYVLKGTVYEDSRGFYFIFFFSFPI